jgi:signal transduction histidine kinase
MVIKISVKNKDGIVVISVSDNGPGIAVENQEKIFAGFYQPEKFFTGNVAGAGLGLLLVKKIVTANGGTIDLKSEIGQGSTVTLSLTSPDK